MFEPCKWLKEQVDVGSPGSPPDQPVWLLLRLITDLFISAASLFMLSAPVRGGAQVCIHNPTVLTSSHHGNQRKRRKKRETDRRRDGEAGTKQGTNFFENERECGAADWSLQVTRWSQWWAESMLILHWWNLFMWQKSKCLILDEHHHLRGSPESQHTAKDRNSTWE